MTRQQFIEEIKRLPVAERVALLEIISRSVREDLAAGKGATPEGRAHPAERRAKHKRRPDEGDELERRTSAVRRLRGALKFDSPPPSDEEVEGIITDYLAGKYS